MTVFIEVISTMWQFIWGLLSGIGKAIFENLSALLELKKVMDCFSPAGLIALSIGVPTIVVTIVIKVIKKFLHRDKCAGCNFAIFDFCMKF